jgi:hypothetical protein
MQTFHQRRNIGPKPAQCEPFIILKTLRLFGRVPRTRSVLECETTEQIIGLTLARGQFRFGTATGLVSLSEEFVSHVPAVCSGRKISF